MSEIEIKTVCASPKIREMLSEILIDVVANGGSVSFMHPLELETADAFWDGALAAAARGERIVLGAWDGEILAGTVTLLLDCPPNQPHRAEIAKLMTRPSHRGRGVAAALMRAAESSAVERGRTLLVLDTATEDGASGLYEKLGFVLAGTIPDYALKPHGGLTGTNIYWKRIGGSCCEAAVARTLRGAATAPSHRILSSALGYVTDSPILLATGNRAKQAKLRWLLDGLGLLTVTPADVGIALEPPETGRSHGEIAAEKALAWSEQVPHAVITSDGGAHIPALGDAWTSIRTRRAAGAEVTDRDRAAHLLSMMHGRTGPERDVVWREAVAIAREGRLLGCWAAEGSLGRLADSYDPADVEGGFWIAGLIVVPRFGTLYRHLTADELAQVDDAWNDLRRRVRADFQATAG